MKRFSKKDLFTIPNLMGYFRILLIPVFCWLYVNAKTPRDFQLATAVVLLSSLTDLFDGMIARKLNQVTELGKVLDPVADKLTHAALALCLTVRYPMMWALLALMLVKEGYMAIMGLHFLKQDKMLDGAMWFGKVCTACLFVGLLILFFCYWLTPTTADSLIWGMMAIMLVTLLLYIPKFREMKQEPNDRS